MAKVLGVTSEPPELLVLGHVTRDETPLGVRLGGAGSYAALAAARLGVRTALVTVAPPDAPLLAALRGVPNLVVHVTSDAVMTTFALDDRGPKRRLSLRARARSLNVADVPAAFRGARVVYIGPVIGECDRALVDAFPGKFVGAGLQGWLRRAAPTDGGLHDGGQIVPALHPEAVNPPALAVGVLSELDHPDVDAVAARFVAAGALVAVTRGAKGASILTSTDRFDIPAAQVIEVDPTGAGDVFGVVLTLQLARGAPPRTAATAAAEAAGRVVEGPGLGRL